VINPLDYLETILVYPWRGGEEGNPHGEILILVAKGKKEGSCVQLVVSDFPSSGKKRLGHSKKGQGREQSLKKAQ